MAVPLRVLMVEDQEDDALLAVRQLERGGFAPAWRRVEDAAAMREALAEGPWDVVLSDWSLPAFSGPEALRVLEESGLDVPFLIVSGTVGEDAAIEAMLAGARDYIVKGRLGRLNAAIERELAEHESREARQRAESALARTQTVRTLGQMAAGIAHDLKNILNPLSLHLQLAERAIARGETAAANESIVAMKQVLVRGVETVERLRAYSRSSPDAHRVDVDLDRLVHEAAEI
ncbi:MAG TPA: response regulator, partial [Minicystis sp.]|nr:response regulator [Minicystis sp.]